MADLSGNGRNHIRVAGKAEITEEHWPSYPQTSRLMMSLYQASIILFHSKNMRCEQKDTRAVIFAMYWVRLG